MRLIALTFALVFDVAAFVLPPYEPRRTRVVVAVTPFVVAQHPF